MTRPSPPCSSIHAPPYDHRYEARYRLRQKGKDAALAHRFVCRQARACRWLPVAWILTFEACLSGGGDIPPEVFQALCAAKKCREVGRIYKNNVARTGFGGRHPK